MSGSESVLVRRIRYVAVRRPVVRGGVFAVMLVPALGRDPLLAVDEPVVLVLCAAVAGSLAYAVHRLRSDRPQVAPDASWSVPAMAVVAAVSLAGLLVCVLAVARGVDGAATSAIVLQLLAALGAAALLGAVRPRRRDTEAPTPQPSGFETSMAHAPVFSGTSIACSGGGIRAAAFCLGGLQRLRFEGQESLYQRADRVYAVSGGSYVATALHMARRHSAQDDAVQASLFGPGSPEEDWLRRRSKYLLPTGSTLVTGFLSVLYGIAVNLTLVGVALFVVAMYVGWIHNVLQVVCPGRGPGAATTCLGDGSPAVFDTQVGRWVLYGWGVLLAGLALFVLGKAVAKYSSRGRLVGAGATRVLVTSGLVVGAVIVVLPWLLVSADNATLDNRPTVALAKGMAAARLATPDGCVAAIERDLTTRAGLAWERATPKQRADSVPFTYGACGGTWTDDAVAFAPGGTVPARPHGTWCTTRSDLPRPTFCDDRPRGGGITFSDTVASWLAAVVALSAAVRGLLGGGRSVATPGSRRSRWGETLRRVVVPWVAAGVVVVAALVVLLVLVRDNLLYPARLHRLDSVVLAALAFVAVRVLSDAMLSSLHPFYRERLSDSFLVRRKPDDDHAAEPLPYRTPTHLHENGALSGPELVICCAANIQDRDYVPAARGCAPFRFRTGAVPSPADDDGADPGAVVQGMIGISDARLPDGRLQPAMAYSATSDPQGLDTTLAAAMAASGAAFSPRVGRMDGRVRPYRMLLALANARLGVWLPNPYLVDRAAVVGTRAASPGEALRWAARRVMKPGPLRIFKEAFGRLSVDDSRIYVTDGGHYDNTAIVEALRDRPRTLVVLDASSDVPDSLDALGDAIVTARMDLGLVVRPAADSPTTQVRRDPDSTVKVIPRGARQAVEEPARARQGWLHLEVFTVEDPRTVVCDVWFVKNVRTADPNIELDTYAAENVAFPVTSTGNQFYGEYDFEAYRLLGYINTTTMLAARAALLATVEEPARAPRPPV